MNITDKDLLAIYMIGWREENDVYSKTYARVYDHPLQQRAYDWGRADFLMGDDLSSIDLQTDEAIINSIRSGYVPTE